MPAKKYQCSPPTRLSRLAKMWYTGSMKHEYTVQDLAKAWGIDEEAVRRRIQRGKLEAEQVDMPGGTWRWRIMLEPDEVERQREEIKSRQQSRSKYATQDEEIADALRIVHDQVARLSGIKKRRYTGDSYPTIEDLKLDLLSITTNTLLRLVKEVQAMRKDIERLRED